MFGKKRLKRNNLGASLHERIVGIGVSSMPYVERVPAEELCEQLVSRCEKFQTDLEVLSAQLSLAEKQALSSYHALVEISGNPRIKYARGRGVTPTETRDSGM